MKRTVSLICVTVFLLTNMLLLTGCKRPEEQQEVRACWVASVGNLDFPSKMGRSADELKGEIDEIVENCVDIGLNTIFFQVRPMGDALYRSEIFPWSVYLSGTQGSAVDGGFDPLRYFVQKAHQANLQLHAWINPYRIGTGTDVLKGLSADNPAVLHPEYTVTTREGLYYDPGLPQVRELILKGVAEIAENYEVDGIHFDDYFYPYTNDDFDDRETYAAYGNGLTLEDFRRESVNQLVKEVRNTVRQYREEIQFGISPFGIWANRSENYEGSDTKGMSSYSAIFSDSKKWVEEGWLDYVCPQIYWSFENEAAPFDVLVDWWDTLCTKYDTDLYIGLALYKAGTEEAGWADGSIMERQLQYASEKESYAGHSFFRYGIMMENPEGALDSVRSFYGTESKKIPTSTVKTSALSIRPMSVSSSAISLQPAESLKITSPSDGTSVAASGISVAGTAPAGQAVWVNGTQAVTNSFGLFAAYVPLKRGTNSIVVSSGGSQKGISVTRLEQSAEAKLSAPYPVGAVHRGVGEVLNFYVEAPAGSMVTLQNQLISIHLYPSAEDPSAYYGQWTIPSLPQEDPLVLEGFTYTAVTSTETLTLQTDLQLNLYPKGYRSRMFLQTDAYQFDHSDGGSQMDHDPLRQNTAVTICGLEGTRALLENGFWVEQSVLGEEPVPPAEALDYDYECVVLSGEEDFLYYTEYHDSFLDLRLSTGRRSVLKMEGDTKDVSFDLVRDAQESFIKIYSRSGRKIAGYEVVPKENGLAIYLRFYAEDLNGMKIVLDAGHGGDDPGALSAGGMEYPSESDLNLVLCRYLQEKLEKAGAEVTLLAAGSESLTLDSRVEKAESLAPDLFLSVHHNSTAQTADFNAASGGLILYSSPISKSLAESIAQTFRSGVSHEIAAACYRQSLRVCRQTCYPAVMLEVGYVCNPVEYEILCSEDIARKIAENTVESLKSYFVTVCS